MKTARSGIRLLATVAVVGILAMAAMAKPARAVEILDDPIQIDDRMTQLIQTSNALCWEMFRYHQQQPNFDEAYRAAKEIWYQADQVQRALRTGPMETAALIQQASEINQKFTALEKALTKWGDGDRSSLAMNASVPVQRTIVAPGVGVNLPLIGVHVGGAPVVVDDEVLSPLERHRLHPNSPGSKRSLERELAATKVAVNYLMEDAGVTATANSPTPIPPEAPTPR
ncbi:MAG: hypothetical protein JSS49_16585 [Planctomycetes bacterium]|nr:hypothetical protein [Planctomycetota bacterium]